MLKKWLFYSVFIMNVLYFRLELVTFAQTWNGNFEVLGIWRMHMYQIFELADKVTIMICMYTTVLRNTVSRHNLGIHSNTEIWLVVVHPCLIKVHGVSTWEKEWSFHSAETPWASIEEWTKLRLLIPFGTITYALKLSWNSISR